VVFVVEKVVLGQVLSEHLSFPCQFLFHLLHTSSRAGAIGQIVADIPSGLSLTPTPRNLKKEKHSGVRHKSDVDGYPKGHDSASGSEEQTLLCNYVTVGCVAGDTRASVQSTAVPCTLGTAATQNYMRWEVIQSRKAVTLV
jgi:hypothetical protein